MDYRRHFAEQFGRFKREMAEAYSSGQPHRLILSCHTAWINAWMRLTWKRVLAEREEILVECEKTGREQLRYHIGDMARKRTRRSEIERLVRQLKFEKRFVDSGESVYYENCLAEIERQIAETEEEIAILEEILPTIAKTDYRESDLLGVLTIFARGSYARGELTFASDVDIGYCLRMRDGRKDLLRTGQELIKRFQDLLSGLPIDLASQYFELDEDLSRFAQTNNLHTIPSILEARPILGNSRLLADLKSQFLAICPKEKMIRYLKTQCDRLRQTPHDTFFIKLGHGGIRHLQLALWMTTIIFGLKTSDTREILSFLRQNGWISSVDVQSAAQSLAFYLELRNFPELYRASRRGTAKNRPTMPKDLLNDAFCSVFIRSGRRFADIDRMDRYRMYAVASVAKTANAVFRLIDSQTVRKRLSRLYVTKQLGTNRIVRFDKTTEKLSWNFQRTRLEFDPKKPIAEGRDGSAFFLNRENLFELFLYIAETGSLLSRKIQDEFSLLVRRLDDLESETDRSEYREFLFRLLNCDYASTAIRQMFDIAAPPDAGGEVKTLLGVFLPPANGMRFLLRNVEVHQHPLCIHSVKALEQVEREIERTSESEPELWKFQNDNTLFALKWATLFHDIGKIDPNADHEKLGPKLSGRLLESLGWEKCSEVQEVSRFLIRNHQAVVRYSQLAAFPDQGIIKLFELAQRDPGRVFLLYLINIADYRSVNDEQKRNTANLERFFKKTIQIFDAFTRERERKGWTLDAAVGDFLNQKVEKTRSAVLYELLLRQCCQKSLEDVVIAPLRKRSPEEIERLTALRPKLERSVTFLKRAELDESALTKHRQLFFQYVKELFAEELIIGLVSPLGENWNWFFRAIPNRYLLGSTTEILTVHLLQLSRFRTKKIAFSFVKGSRGEYDTILFCCLDDISAQQRIAYALGRRGISIENGKINTVRYLDGKTGIVGFLRISHSCGNGELAHADLEAEVENLQTPKLILPTEPKKERSPTQIRFFTESEKGYLVRETDGNRFERARTEFGGVRISLTDRAFCYFKLMSAFESRGTVPVQVAITTIGDQIIDYFYLEPKERHALEQNGFAETVGSFIDSTVAV